MLVEAGCSNRNPRLKRWLIGLLIFLLVSLLAINSFSTGQFRILPGGNSNQVSYIEKPQLLMTSSVQNGYLVNNKGCRIPDLNPFEPSVKRFFDKADPIVCDYGTHLPLIDSNNSAVFVNPEARAHYYNETESTDCCWRTFWRNGYKDNEVAFSRDCHAFQEAAFINDEFVRVECQLRNESIYKDYFAFVPRKLHVEERCRQQRKELRDSSGTVPTRRQLSLLVLGVDSVSRLNLHRTMPRTVHLLQQLGAVEMLGYNKVADNTYPNLVPVLSGLSENEFESLCWKNHKEPFDRCPFIWKAFQAKGYRTVLAEDACSMATFNYQKPGFRLPPVDYYLRPYCVASETDIGNSHKLNAHLCVGTRLNFENLLHYTHKVASEFADAEYFAFFWESSLTHDFLEYSQLGDKAYEEAISHLAKKDLLQSTAVVFMSDHGMRWGSFRQTYQGRLEDRLPFCFILLPEWWRLEHPAAWATLARNSRSLTTPFDLHETLLDLLEPSRLASKEEPISSSPAARGISMFKAIPEHRTCDTAGIPEHYCMCHTRYNVSRDDPAIGRLSHFLLGEINALLVVQPRCAHLELAAVVDVKALGSEEAAEKEERPWTDYTLTIEARPGGAILEASMRLRVNGNMTLLGSVTRLDAYGTQSLCVDDFHLRLYCYCT